MGETTREEAEIVGKLYAGILHKDRWHTALKAVCAHVGGQHSALMLLEPPGRVASGEILAKAEEHKHREFQFWAEQTVSL